MGQVAKRWRPPRSYLTTIPDKDLHKYSRAELVSATKIVDEIRKREARTDPNAFIEYINGDDPDFMRQAWFHEEMQAALGKHQKVAVEVIRDGGKTSQGVDRLVWEFGHNPDLRVKVIGESDPRARDRVWEVRQLITHNHRVQKVFPHLRAADEGDWSKARLTLHRRKIMRDPSLEGRGVLSPGTGSRADLLFGDDPVGRRNALTQPKLRPEVIRAWKSDWMNTLEPSGRIWYLFTPWHRADLSADIKTNPNYKHLSFPVDGLFGSIWPERWPERILREKYVDIGAVEYARAFQLLPSADDETLVREEWIKYVNLAKMGRANKIFLLSYDLASSKGDDANYTACVLIALDSRQRKMVVLDAWRKRMDFPEQVDSIKGDAKRLGAEVVIETIGYQESLLKFLHREEPWIRAHGFRPHVSKDERTKMVTPYMQRGNVLFSDTLKPDVVDGSRGCLITQLLDAIKQGNDMRDAFTQGVLWGTDVFFGVKDQQDRGGVRAYSLD